MRPIWGRGTMWGDGTIALAVMILLPWILPCKSLSAPGKPKLKGCRSPEKETFTCWWEPGSTGGLPTTYRLFYRKERLDQVFECPDYHSAGNNSCFFSKAHTSIWVIYNITVIASNAYGNAFSESLEVDVMDIVQPHSPENVTLTVVGEEDNPYFLVQWEAPHDTDIRSGWVTLKYEVRVKLENHRREQVNQWEVYSAGKQREMSIYSPQPGGRYIVQVRCRLDEGTWSDWSAPTFVQIPNIYQNERSVVVYTAIISAFFLLITAGILVAKRKHVKHCLLPPVPGPKIKGLDAQLVKAEKSEDLFNALTSPGFPPTVEYPDLVDFLLVVDSEEDSEEYGNKAPEEHQKTHPLSSALEDTNLSTERKLNLIQTDRWKGPSIVQDCQDCDPESMLGSSQNVPVTFTFQQKTQPSNCLGTYKVPQQDPDIDIITSCKIANMIKNSQSSCMISFEQNKVSVTPIGPTEPLETKKIQGCIRASATEEGEDYSKVSDINNDTVLVLQKNSISVHTSREENCNDVPWRIKDEKSFSAEDATNVQDYVITI